MTKQSPTRLFVMLPMLFLMGKVDFTNENILFAARASFFTCQVIQLLIALWIKTRIEAKKDMRKIYVPAAPASPFSDPQEAANAPLTETTYYDHEMTKVSEFIKQSGIGACMSSFIHFKFGVNQVLAIQSVMIPMNLFENPLVKAFLIGRGPNDRIWDEKLENETASTDAAKEKKGSIKSDYPKSPKEAITRAWDDASDADFNALLKVVKASPNAKTQDGWTALMVAVGSPVDTSEFIQSFCKFKATNVKATDNDGWTALHWAAFHGRPEAAQVLLDSVSSADVQALITIKDNEGKTAIEVAKGEGNDDVVTILRSYSTQKTTDEESSLRRRKGVEDSEISDVD